MNNNPLLLGRQVSRCGKTIFLIVITTWLFACGGGGGSGDTEDTTAPALESTTPTNGSSDVELDSNITATFNEELDPDTVNADTFVVAIASDGQSISGVVSFDSSALVATFNPDADLPDGEAIDVTLTSAITDLAGNALADGEDQDFSFITIAVDSTAPTASILPEDGAENVAVDTVIVVTFDEPINIVTVNPDSFSVSGAVSGDVSGDLGFDADNAEVTFTPDASLANGEEFTVTLTSTIEDLAGNAFAGETTSFTTIALPLPEVAVLSRSPGIDETGVLIAGTAVEVGFNEELNASTVNDASFNVSTDTDSLPGTVSVNDDEMNDGMQATFAPDRCLPSGTEITVDLADTIESSEGGAFIGETYSFNTIPGWSDSQQVDDPMFLDASGLRVASDGADRAAILRFQERDLDGSANDVVANVYDINGCAWGEPVVLDDLAGAVNGTPGISMLGSVMVGTEPGGFLATWEQNDDLLFSVFDPATLEWSDPGVVRMPANADDEVSTSTLAISSSGNALSVWGEGPIPTAGGGMGMGMAAPEAVYASIFNGAEWEEAQLVSDIEGPVTGLSAGLDASGNAVVAFEQDIDADTGIDVAVSLFDGTEWVAPVAVDAEAENAQDVFVNVNDGGDAIIVWEQDDDDADTDATARGFVLEFGELLPGPGVTVFDPGATFTGGPNDLTGVINNDGDAFVVWVQSPGDTGTATSDTVLAVDYNATDGFSAVEEISTNSNTADVNAEHEAVGFGADGSAIAYWSLVTDDGTNPATTLIQTSTFDGADWGAPETVVGPEDGNSTNLELTSGTGIGDFLVRLRDDSADNMNDDVRSIINRDNATVESIAP